jgi:serine/threonine protein kinase
MEVRCPQCDSSIDVAEDTPLSDVACPSCGSSVSLLGEETLTYQAAVSKTIRHSELMGKAGRVISHYRLDERVGAGGMGEVYRAYDLALGRDCALKVLRSGFPSNLRDRLLREAETCARLQHPGIATFFEAGEAEGEAFIAMEYVVGQTLRERLGRGPLPVDVAMTMTARLLEALGHAHA